MDESNNLFTTKDFLKFQFIKNLQLKAAAKVPLLILMTLLAALALAVVGYSEWEIIYRVFDYLAGDYNEYWSPSLMGFTAATMIIGFHILAKSNPHNLAVRIVNQCVAILIPVYLIGLGLLIACILFADGLSGMLNIDIQAMIGSIPEALEQGWIDAFFANVTNPLAVLTFSLGIGGLAIVNIFIAHKLLTMIAINTNDAYSRLSRANAAIKDYQIILNAQKEYSALNSQINDLLIKDDSYIQTLIINEVMSVIADALLPHKKWLQDSQYSLESRFEETHRKIDPKQIAKDIAKIEAIRPQDIMNAMNPKFLEKGK